MPDNQTVAIWNEEKEKEWKMAEGLEDLNRIKG